MNMKTVKQILCFLIVNILLVVIKYIYYFSNIPSTSIIGGADYATLLFTSELFFKALFNTALIIIQPAIIVSIISILVAVIKLSVDKKKTFNYIIYFFVSIVLGIICNFIFAPVFTVLNSIAALQLGTYSAFVFWLADKLINIIKARKNATVQ